MANVCAQVLPRQFREPRPSRQSWASSSVLGGQLAVLVTVGLYVALPAKLTVWPAWLVPSLELVPLLAIAIAIRLTAALEAAQTAREHDGRARPSEGLRG